MQTNSMPPLSGDAAEALEELATRLKHDLGKYIAMVARFLPPDASESERLDALKSDLLLTRRGPDGSMTAHEVWAPFATILAGTTHLAEGHAIDLRGTEPVSELFAGMAALEPLVDQLKQGEMQADELARAEQEARRVSAAAAALVKAVRISRRA